MAKVIQRPIKPGKGTLSKVKTVYRSTVTGRFLPKNSVSANSRTFTSDLGRAFSDNVAAVLRTKK